MKFIDSVTSSGETSALGTGYGDVLLPPTIASGQLIVIAGACYLKGSASAFTVSGGGYTSDTIPGPSTARAVAGICWKVANGTEGGTTVQVKIHTGGGQRPYGAVAAVYRFPSTLTLYTGTGTHDQTNDLTGPGPTSVAATIVDTGTANHQNAIIAFVYGNNGAIGDPTDLGPALTAVLTTADERDRISVEDHMNNDPGGDVRDMTLVLCDMLNYTGNPTDPTFTCTDAVPAGGFFLSTSWQPWSHVLADPVEEVFGTGYDMIQRFLSIKDLPYTLDTGLLKRLFE